MKEARTRVTQLLLLPESQPTVETLSVSGTLFFSVDSELKTVSEMETRVRFQTDSIMNSWVVFLCQSGGRIRQSVQQFQSTQMLCRMNLS